MKIDATMICAEVGIEVTVFIKIGKCGSCVRANIDTAQWIVGRQHEGRGGRCSRIGIEFNFAVEISHEQVEQNRRCRYLQRQAWVLWERS